MNGSYLIVGPDYADGAALYGLPVVVNPHFIGNYWLLVTDKSHIVSSVHAAESTNSPLDATISGKCE